ncbi:membrane hypothetical protein [Thermococcus barophilus]|uniref:Uncharacterized protein n=1 Tax=Thermococcus barophilus TaxID=55802 RepID=A0A0S1X8V0_THEBA|nr:membrane hypothetical protein [Thermococcus barophilus]
MMSWNKLGVYAGMFIGSLYFLFLLVYRKRIGREGWLLNIEIALFVLSISIANYMSLRGYTEATVPGALSWAWLIIIALTTLYVVKSEH